MPSMSLRYSDYGIHFNIKQEKKVGNKPAVWGVELVGRFSSILSLLPASLRAEPLERAGCIYEQMWSLRQANSVNRRVLIQGKSEGGNSSQHRLSYLADWDGVEFKGRGAAVANTNTEYYTLSIILNQHLKDVMHHYSCYKILFHLSRVSLYRFPTGRL